MAKERKSVGKSVAVEKNSKKTEKKQNSPQDSDEIIENQLRLMKLSFDIIVKSRKFSPFKNPLETTTNTIGLIGIVQKFDSYNNIDEFMDDLNDLVKSYSVPAKKDGKMKKVLNSLLEMVERDICCIKTCTECFEYWISGAMDFFALACSKPHLLVYAKVDIYPHWPAKVMSIKNNAVNVEFFGDHTQAEVPLKSCFLYSDDFEPQNPSANLKSAIEELDNHIENIRKKCGTFVSAPFKTILNMKNMKQHLLNMFPDSFNDDSTGEVEDDDSTDEVDVDVSSLDGNEQVSDNTFDATMDNTETSTTNMHSVVSTLEESDSENEEVAPTPSKNNKRKISEKESGFIVEENPVAAKRVRISNLVEVHGTDDNETNASAHSSDDKRQIVVKKDDQSQINIEKLAETIEELKGKKLILEKKLAQIKKEKSKAKTEWEQCHEKIWNLKHQMVIAENGMKCTNCSTSLDGLLYCSEQCRVQNEDE